MGLSIIFIEIFSNRIHKLLQSFLYLVKNCLFYKKGAACHYLKCTSKYAKYIISYIILEMSPSGFSHVSLLFLPPTLLNTRKCMFACSNYFDHM